MSKIIWEDDFYDCHERDEWIAEHEDDLISLGDGAWLQFDDAMEE